MTLESREPSRQFLTMLTWGALVVCAILALVAHLRLWRPIFDDAFITYRYAANFAAGRGLVYNPDERVLGTTTPAYALLLGAVATITGSASLPVVSLTVNLLALLASAAAGWLVVRRVTGDGSIGAIASSLILIGSNTLYASLAGMETPLFVMILALVWWSSTSRRWLLVTILAGFLPLIRPEGVFVLGLVALGMIAMSLKRSAADLRPGRLALLLTFMVLPVTIWGVFAWMFYGSPIPLTITAKRHGLYPIGVRGSLSQVIDFVLRDLILSGNWSRPGLTLIPQLLPLVLILVLFILISGALWIARRWPQMRILLALLAILITFYAASETLIFPHYVANFETLLLLCWWAGLSALAMEFARLIMPLAAHAGLQRRIAGVCACLTLLPSVVAYPWDWVWLGEVNPQASGTPELRQEQYRILAEQIGPYLPSGTVVLMPEIGELGFYLAHVRVLDSAGLVSPEAVPYHPVPAERRLSADLGVIPPELVRDYKPDLIITLEIFGRDGLLVDPWFRSNYTRVMRRAGNWLPWLSEGLYVFSRNDFAPGMKLQTINP